MGLKDRKNFSLPRNAEKVCPISGGNIDFSGEKIKFSLLKCVCFPPVQRTKLDVFQEKLEKQWHLVNMWTCRNGQHEDSENHLGTKGVNSTHIDQYLDHQRYNSRVIRWWFETATFVREIYILHQHDYYPMKSNSWDLYCWWKKFGKSANYGKYPFVFPVGFHQILQFHRGMNSPRKHWDPISISRPQGADPPYWVQLDMIHSDFSRCFKNTGFNHESRIPGKNPSGI